MAMAFMDSTFYQQERWRAGKVEDVLQASPIHVLALAHAEIQGVLNIGIQAGESAEPENQSVKSQTME
jgi:hypothetical protein